MVIGTIAALFGLIALLWHFQRGVAIVFSIASIAGWISYIVFGVLMDKDNPENDSKPK